MWYKCLIAYSMAYHTKNYTPFDIHNTKQKPLYWYILLCILKCT